MIYTYELDFWTHWRLVCAAPMAMPIRLVSAMPLMVAAGIGWASDRGPAFIVIASLVGLALSGAFYLFNRYVANAFQTAVTRWSSPGLAGTHTIELSERGVELKTADAETLLPWASILEARYTGAAVLLRTDRWHALPRSAFGVGEQDALDFIESRRGTAEFLGDVVVAAPASPYAPPQVATEGVARSRAAIPARKDDVLVRVFVVWDRISDFRMQLRSWWHRPRQLIQLLVPIALYAVFSRDPYVIVRVGGFVAAAMSWIIVAQGRMKRRALGGIPEVTDVTAAGFRDWGVASETFIPWADVALAVEERDSFFVYSRRGTFLYLRKDSVEGGDWQPLRAVLREHLSHRARLAA